MWEVKQFKNKKIIMCSECGVHIDCEDMNINESEFDFCPYCGSQQTIDEAWIENIRCNNCVHYHACKLHIPESQWRFFNHMADDCDCFKAIGV